MDFHLYAIWAGSLTCLFVGLISMDTIRSLNIIYYEIIDILGLPGKHLKITIFILYLLIERGTQPQPGLRNEG